MQRFFSSRAAWSRFGLAVLVVSSLSFGACSSVPRQEESASSLGEVAAARRNIGIDHVVNGRVPLGIRELRHALTLREEDSLAHLWLGQAFLMKGRLPDAERHAERSLELDPESHEARLNVSVVYIHTGQFDEAIAESDVLIDDPTFATPWRAFTNRGWAQLKLERRALARESFEDALEFHPDYWPALLNLGILAQIEGDYVGSLRSLEGVLSLAPGGGPEAEVHYRLAEAYVSLGHRERALHHLGQAIEVSPNGRWGRQSREYLALLQ